MTSRDAGLSGSYNCSETSEQQGPLNSAMSATTVYPAPYYPPTTTTFIHNSANPTPNLYRRPSQPGIATYSNQCPPVPNTSSFTVSDPQTVTDMGGAARNNLGGPLPPSSNMHQYQPIVNQQPPAIRTNTNTPITHTLSQPHPRIPSFSSPATPIDPAIRLDIVYHPVSEIVTMLASKLQNLITTNDRLRIHSPASSRTAYPTSATPNSSRPESRLLSFHARNIPSITITAYLNRILKYCPTDPEVFISVLVYFDRILRIANESAQPIFGSYFASYNVIHNPPLVHSPLPPHTHDDDNFTIDSFNVHRLVITTIAVATKFFSDQFYTNSRYARVGGLPLAELNHLEIQFLILQDFNLMIPPAEIQFYADHLLHFWIMEQQRQTDRSFMGIVPPQPPTNLEYNTPVTPITPAHYFPTSTPTSSTTYVPTTPSSATTVGAVYPPFQPQFAAAGPQPVDCVQPTDIRPHDPQQNEHQ